MFVERSGYRSKTRTGRTEDFDSDKFVSDLKSQYDDLKNWRFFARTTVNRIKHNQLLDLSWVFVDLLFDWKTNYPREITDLLLDMINCRVYLVQQKKKQDKLNLKMFLKVRFTGKNVEKVRIASILRKHLDSIPLQSKAPPVVVYQRSKTIGASIFNYKDTVDNVVTNDWNDNTLVCDCKHSAFCDPHHGHVVTGDLRIIENKKLRSLLCKGPTYREPRNVNWDKFLEDFESSLLDCVDKWALSEKVDSKCFKEWMDKVLEDVVRKIQKLKNSNQKYKSVLSSPDVKLLLTELQKKYVFVPTDKASNNIAIVCKKFYIEKSMEELGIQMGSIPLQKDGSTYVMVDKDRDKIIKQHKRYMKSNFGVEEIPNCFPFLYWIPKMHKKPFSKQRYIAASYSCTTKFLSAVLTKCLKLVEKQHRIICQQFFNNYGINPMWILHKSNSVHDMAADFNRKRNARNVRTYDFSTLYTSIPHKQLKNQLSWVIKEAFKSSKKSFISVYREKASWTNTPRKKNYFYGL